MLALLCNRSPRFALPGILPLSIHCSDHFAPLFAFFGLELTSNPTFSAHSLRWGSARGEVTKGSATIAYRLFPASSSLTLMTAGPGLPAPTLNRLDRKPKLFHPPSRTTLRPGRTRLVSGAWKKLTSLNSPLAGTVPFAWTASIPLWRPKATAPCAENWSPALMAVTSRKLNNNTMVQPSSNSPPLSALDAVRRSAPMTFAGWIAVVPSMSSMSNALTPPSFVVSQRPNRHPPPRPLSLLLLLLPNRPLHHQTRNSGRSSQPLSLRADARESLSQRGSCANISTVMNTRSWCPNATPASSTSFGAQTAQDGSRGAVGTTIGDGISGLLSLRHHPINFLPLMAKRGGHLRRFWTTWGLIGPTFPPRPFSSTGRCFATFLGVRGGSCVLPWLRSSARTLPPAIQWPGRSQA